MVGRLLISEFGAAFDSLNLVRLLQSLHEPLLLTFNRIDHMGMTIILLLPHFQGHLEREDEWFGELDLIEVLVRVRFEPYVYLTVYQLLSIIIIIIVTIFEKYHNFPASLLVVHLLSSFPSMVILWQNIITSMKDSCRCCPAFRRLMEKIEVARK